MSGISTLAYRAFTKRFSTILLTASVSVFAFDIVFNKATNAYWEHKNKGKLWKDVKEQLAVEQ
uniref:Complex III subunit 9 n=1 Tax=Strongyloides stercoralis TaxID=6248 RepID=A0A0K0EKP9_STRER